jgi:N6-adenosine-specific RNA methylase IME4
MNAPSLIYADPPWQFKVRDRASGLDRAPDAHYRTTATHDLFGFLNDHDVIPEKDALLAMWVYDPMLPDAIRLAEAWGFSFTTVLFRWMKTASLTADMFGDDKLAFGLGYHTRGGGCEEVWLFKRGKGLPVLRHDIRREFYAPRREHSRKPACVRDWLVDLYGDVPRVELFARERATGWMSIGDEVGKFGDAA